MPTLASGPILRRAHAKVGFKLGKEMTEIGIAVFHG